MKTFCSCQVCIPDGKIVYAYLVFMGKVEKPVWIGSYREMDGPDADICLVSEVVRFVWESSYIPKWSLVPELETGLSSERLKPV